MQCSTLSIRTPVGPTGSGLFSNLVSISSSGTNQLEVYFCPQQIAVLIYYCCCFNIEVNPLQDSTFNTICYYSVAMLRYLASKYNVPEHWYPTNDLLKQARIEEYLHWQHLNTRMQAAMLFQQKVSPLIM